MVKGVVGIVNILPLRLVGFSQPAGLGSEAAVHYLIMQAASLSGKDSGASSYHIS